MTIPRLFDLAPESNLAVEHVCDIAVELAQPLVFPTPIGHRRTVIATGGTVSGQLTGEMLAAGGDWIVVGADGVARMDIRQTIRTNDGALIHYAARGIIRLPADGRERIARGELIPFAESYIHTTPRFETSDERYAWLNGQVFITVGEYSPNHIDHRVYRVL